jgi:FAD:protein FMN transferase
MTAAPPRSAGAASDSFLVFGTRAVLLVSAPRLLARARALADAELAAVDLAASRFRPDSELSALNAAAGAWLPVSELLADLLEVALRAARLTAGAVDPTCGHALIGLGYDRDFDEIASGTEAGAGDPGRVTGPVPGWRCLQLDRRRRRARLRRGAQLDLGATAKARAADRCAGLIAARLGTGVLVSLGGDIAVAGPAPDGGWRVRVTDDHAAGPDAPGQTVTIRSGGLATSGTAVRTWTVGGRRVHHIIDPATGRPARPCWRTVTVAAGSCLEANIASTAAIVRGAAARDWLAELALPARLTREDGSVVTTAGWPADSGRADPAGVSGAGADRTEPGQAEVA